MADERPVVPQSDPGVEWGVEVGIGNQGDDATFLYDDPGSTYDGEAVYSAGEITWKAVTVRGIRFTSNRGRDTFQDRFRTGTLAVTLENDDGLFTPDYGALQLGQLQLRPGRYLRVLGRVIGDTDWVPICAGQIQNITDQYVDAAFGIRATFNCLELSARLQLNNPPALTTPVPAERSDLRVARVLQSNGFDPDQLDLDVGQFQVAASNLADSSLEEIQKCADAEGGAFYFDRDGRPRFRKFSWLDEGDTPEGSPQFLIGFGGQLAPYVEILDTSASWDLSRVRNDIQMARAGGTAQRVNNPTSVALYGQRSWRRFDLINTTDSAVYTLAERTLERQAFDRVRLGRLRVQAFTAAAARQLLALEVGTRVRVLVQTLGQSALSWAYVTDAWVFRIQHTGTAGDWQLELTVDNTDTGDPFVGGPFDIGWSAGFNWNQNEGDTALRTWAVEFPDSAQPNNLSHWDGTPNLDTDAPGDFTLATLLDYYDQSNTGSKRVVGAWGDDTAPRRWRVAMTGFINWTSGDGIGTTNVQWPIPAQLAPGTPLWLVFRYAAASGDVECLWAPADDQTNLTSLGVQSPGRIIAAPDPATYLRVGQFDGLRNNSVRNYAVEYYEGVGAAATGNRVWRWTGDHQEARDPGSPTCQSFNAWTFVPDPVNGPPALVNP